MKHLSYFTKQLIAATMLAAPMMVSAQANIQKAFEKFLDNPSVSYIDTHKMDKDVANGTKINQTDVYRFTLPASKKALIDEINKAFKKDVDKSYSYVSGVSSNNDILQQLHVGDNQNALTVNLPVGCHYAYQCFLAPKNEDPDGKYRYAYAYNWLEHDGEITGFLAISYATTLQYRQQQAMAANSVSNLDSSAWGGMDMRGLKDNKVITTRNMWFSKLMSYVQIMGNNSSVSTQRAIAGKIYELTNDIEHYPPMSEQDKATAKDMLKIMHEDPKFNDAIVQQLLKSSLKNIK